MFTNNNSRLTSTEITNLFTQYIQDTLSICISKHVLATVKDSDVRSLFEFAMGLSEKHVIKIKEILKKENFPVPNGLTEEDVNLEAPPLFADIFWLHYLHTMTHNGLTGYSLSFGNSIRQDMQDYYYQCNIDAMEVYKMCVGILLSKGLYEKPPYFSIPQTVEYITNVGYVLDVIGKKRPLNSAEAGNIFFNLIKNRLVKAVLLGFSQVAKNKDVRQYFEKSLKTSNKNFGIFSSLLREEHLNFPKLLDQEVTNSTIQPFSDKLMMICVGFLQGSAISYYGTALVSSLRADLIGQCEAAILRVMKGVPNWGNIIIENGWIEKLPEANDRQELPNN
ncbi:hypothetical protein WQ54_15780 [Bacillus sp. SA1-12]|uniref:DUF3231 family protein n=1 Tax=Bacillus sp. SA1-12 TaxID=1455638 RepID=UPI000627046D|nr:DUF3231 family protein [Bacillus sp. SA1-12]KKI91278.1 hypothetical protein WQ54_15780 [Bacillus sp. SA1-12]